MAPMCFCRPSFHTTVTNRLPLIWLSLLLCILCLGCFGFFLSGTQGSYGHIFWFIICFQWWQRIKSGGPLWTVDRIVRCFCFVGRWRDRERERVFHPPCSPQLKNMQVRWTGNFKLLLGANVYACVSLCVCPVMDWSPVFVQVSSNIKL